MPEVRDEREYRSYDIPRMLLDFPGWIQNRINDIPEDRRGDAKINLVLNCDDGPALEISYMRPETPKEQTEREFRERHKRQHELRLLAQLKAKYEGGQ